MKTSDEVTLKVGWPMLAVALPILGIFDVGLLWAVVSAIVHDDADYPFSGMTGGGVVFGWVLVGIFVTLCTAGVVNLPLLRVRCGDGRIRMRKLFTYKTIMLDDLTSAVVTNPPAWQVNGPRSSVAPCLELRGSTPSGRRAYIGINDKLLDYSGAVRWLASWLRAHPERTDQRTLDLLDHLDDVPPPEPEQVPRTPISAPDLVRKLQQEERLS